MQQIYNIAVEKLNILHIEETRHLLNKCMKANWNPSLIQWTLGLLEASIGYPHKALTHWAKVNAKLFPQVESRFDEVQAVLPIYEELYSRYNQAVDAMREGENEKSIWLLKGLFSEQDKYPLPIEFYRGYFMALLIEGDIEKVEKEIKSCPLYVQLSSEIQRILDISQLMANELVSSNVQSVSGKYKPFKYALVASIVSVVITVSAAMLFLNENHIKVAEPDNKIQSEFLNDNLAEEISRLEEQLGNIQEEKRELVMKNEQLIVKNDQLMTIQEQNNGVIEKYNNMLSNLDAVGITQQELSFEAALTSYRTGRVLYKEGHFEEAFDTLLKSYNFKSNTYFSDDSLYYAIQAGMRAGIDTTSLYDNFLATEDENFINSPYYDDIMLQKAKHFIELNNYEAARAILKDVIANYEMEWTAKQANLLLQKLK